MKIFFDHIFACYDSLVHIGSDEIIKRLQMWLNNPQGGLIEGRFYEDVRIFQEANIGYQFSPIPICLTTYPQDIIDSISIGTFFIRYFSLSRRLDKL